MGLTIAIALLLLLHVPPGMLVVRLNVLPRGMEVGPEMLTVLDGVSTVITFVPVTVPQEVTDVCVMTVEPAATPVTTPALTVAMVGWLETQVPLLTSEVSEIVLPTQTDDKPPTVSTELGLTVRF